MRIGVAYGGFTSEAEISEKSGTVVFETLREKLTEVYRIIIGPNQWMVVDEQDNQFPLDIETFEFKQRKETRRFDVIFNAVHGAPGEDGQLAQILEHVELPHTSCPSKVAALTYDKIACLEAAKKIGIKTAKSTQLSKSDPIAIEEILNKISLPCFVKANKAGSSFGVYKVHHQNQLEQAILSAFEEDDQVLIETALIGREVSVGAVTLDGKIEVLPITEIITGEDFFNYEAKYLGKSQEITPADLTPEIEKDLQQIVLSLYQNLNLSGLVRVDFIIVDNEPHMLEINTVPGLTRASIVPQQNQCTGRSLFELFYGMLQSALSKK